jgi:hypothetical protein
MEDERIDEFRESIRKIKEAVHDKIAYSSQNLQVLDIIIVELREYYNKLLNKLRNENISPDVRKRMIYYLRRDLLMFPYTYDKERIDTFSAKNSMEVTS